MPEVSSFRTTSPPFITNRTRCSSVTSASGSPERAIRSAYLPGSSVPTCSWSPSSSAAREVAARIASMGGSPARWSATTSQALRPWPRAELASKPLTIFTPSLCASATTLRRD